MFVLNSLSAGQALTVAGVNVLNELSNKQSSLGGSSVVAVSQLTATNELVSDSIRANTDNGLTCADDLAVTGELTVQGVNMGNALAAKEPAFTAVAPLQKVVNLQSGALELRVDTSGLGGSPFFCAGKVAPNGAVLTRKGQHPNFTVSRVGTGVYNVVFESAHPDGADYVASANAETFHEWIVVGTVTSTGFQVGVRDSGNAARDLHFSFTVLA
jgi:hypothetical protein